MTTVLLALSLAAGCTNNAQRPDNIQVSTVPVRGSAGTVDEGVGVTRSGPTPSTSPMTVSVTSSGPGGTTEPGTPIPGVAVASPVTVPSTISRPVATVPPPVAPAGVEATLACIRSYEGSYTSNTGNGHFGAYQFNQATWDGAVARAGYPEWSGRRASEAPPEVQDAAAVRLLSERGLQPWPTPNRMCR